MSREQLGIRLGMTAADVAAFESGEQHIGSQVLFKLANLFDLPLSAFFEGYTGSDDSAPEDQMNSALQTIDTDLLLRLVRAFMNIKEPQVREYAIRLLERLSRSRRDE